MKTLKMLFFTEFPLKNFTTCCIDIAWWKKKPKLLLYYITTQQKKYHQYFCIFILFLKNHKKSFMRKFIRIQFCNTHCLSKTKINLLLLCWCRNVSYTFVWVPISKCMGAHKRQSRKNFPVLNFFERNFCHCFKEYFMSVLT